MVLHRESSKRHAGAVSMRSGTMLKILNDLATDDEGVEGEAPPTRNWKV